MSGPIIEIEESVDEREARHNHTVILPEEACTGGIAL